MEDTVLVQAGVVVLVARYPADEASFSATGTVVKAPINAVEPGMLYDGSTFTAPR
jgi:hypothetical protein